MTYSRAEASRLLRAMPRIFGPKVTFCSTVRQGNSAKLWNTTPRSGPGPLISWALSRTLPDEGLMKPAMMLRTVVLPQPLGPRMETKSPFSTLNDTSSMAVTISSVNSSS